MNFKGIINDETISPFSTARANHNTFQSKIINFSVIYLENWINILFYY